MRCRAGRFPRRGHTAVGSPTYQGAPVRPLEIPLDGPVIQADPLVLPVLVWGTGGVLGRGHIQVPQHHLLGGSERVLGAEFGEIWGLGVSGRWGCPSPCSAKVLGGLGTRGAPKGT